MPGTFNLSGTLGPLRTLKVSRRLSFFGALDVFRTLCVPETLRLMKSCLSISFSM
jgi:hypothetical protein